MRQSIAAQTISGKPIQYNTRRTPRNRQRQDFSFAVLPPPPTTAAQRARRAKPGILYEEAQGHFPLNSRSELQWREKLMGLDLQG